ncbi:MAG: hypothetical protein OXC80_00335, partial [Gammaproteobacteria bacterium]|nr:hypothetical protein [Gammaproteobacteria bacterium]
CTYKPDQPGQYRLVTEMEIDGETRWHSSNTVVQDDHQDSVDDATVVGVTSSTLGWLEIDDEDFFRVDVTESGTLTAYTEGWIDTKGSLLNDNGTILTSNDDGGNDRNFHLAGNIDAGTYYIRVYGDYGTTGEYRLHVEFQIAVPDLVVDTAELSATPTVGEKFTLNVQVYNQGNGNAEATILRFYRSDDSSITRSDKEIGTSEVGELADGEFSEHSIEVTVEDEGTYSYGACVDAVDGEENTSNNCSSAAEELTSFELDASNGHSVGVTAVDNLLYVVDWIDKKVYTYTRSGERRADADFDLDEETLWAQSITHADGIIYVAVYFRNSAHRVHAYTYSGERSPDTDIVLEERAPWWPDGMVYADDVIYIADDISDYVFAYTTSGERLPDSGFVLPRGNRGIGATGMAYSNGLLYVLDRANGKVLAFTLTGTRRPDSDFDLVMENTAAEGITYYNGRFYVVDEEQDKIYVYDNNATN